MKKLSVIIPIFNVEDYLPECLNSLKKQNFGSDVEVILVNDGSADDSINVCRRLISGDEHFKIINQRNAGVSMARNTGLSVAEGEYIAWIDPDDYIADDWYEAVTKALKKNVDLIFFDYVNYNPKLNIKRDVKFSNESFYVNKNKFIYELTRNYKLESQMWSKVIKKKFFEGETIFKENLSVREDFDVLTKIAHKINSIYYLSRTLYIYRQRDSSLVHQWDQSLYNVKINVELSFYRNAYLKSKGYIISESGLLLDCFKFCKCYQLDGKMKTLELNDVYVKSLIKIRENIFKVLFDSRYNFIGIIDYVATCFGWARSIRHLKSNIANYIKRMY